MSRYQQLAEDIVRNVGGKENIISLVHCVTRLRFNLKDESKVNENTLKNMSGVIGIVKSSGQFQVVIGNHVPDVYKVVCEVVGISNKNGSDIAGKKNELKR
ncbi:MAG: PTS transporter subunit EIIB [Lachnospiraceae bacterium]